MEAIAAAEEFGDPDLTARVIGAYDVPAIWTRNDDPEQARRIVDAAERALTALPGDAHEAARCRLLATIALETRGSRAPRGPQAAREAEEIARRLDDPALLAFALNGAFMQSFTRAGLAPRRDEIGAELVELAARHDLVTYEVLGHLIRLQARGALADFAAADRHAAAVDRLAERHELPLASVFTQWYRALRLAASGNRRGRDRLPGRRRTAGRRRDAGPGAWTSSARPAVPAGAAQEDVVDTDSGETGPGAPGRGYRSMGYRSTRFRSRAGRDRPGADWGPYRPWAAPFALLASGRRAEARAALRALPEPPRDLMYEACCCLEAVVALEVGDRDVLERARARLLPAAGELAGAGSGLITLGPVEDHLADITTALRAPTSPVPPR